MPVNRPDVAIFAGEALWPTTQGGRVRTAAICTELAKTLDVACMLPHEQKPSSVPAGLRLIPFQTTPNPRAKRHLASLAPRNGRAVVHAGVRRNVLAALADLKPQWTLFAQGYLSAVVPYDGQRVVDFQNIEVARFKSLARQTGGAGRWTAALEAAKARRWEPRVARNAQIAVAVNERDAKQLRQWTHRVIVVPNAAADMVGCVCPSPIAGPAVFVASATYRPNYEAGLFLINQVWPKVRARLATAQLDIVGRGSAEVFGSKVAEGVRVHGTVPEVEPYVDSAAILLAPVKFGGGTQLKLTQGVARGRVAVTTTYSARSLPSAVASACVVADDADEFADAVARLLADHHERHRREVVLRAQSSALPTWSSACQPLIDVIANG